MTQAHQFYNKNIDHKKILKKFLHLNNLKLTRTRQSLKQRSFEFFNVLPLLFHINHPALPGFVSSQCPAGIVKYNPDKDTIRYAHKLAKAFSFKRRAYRQYDILALYFMGSTGTIAYSDKSDFDIWVCYREDLDDIQIKELETKTQHLSQWCLQFNLEVNFFLVNTKKFRQGQIDQLSTESSGTSQHLLLLEEFYRTSILLAGRYPIWWLVPPQYEQNYDEYVENIVHRRLLNSHDFLNFGSINQIQADEFYGATLWHIYKGIDSPYKSILKLLLMECYAKEYPNIQLLSYQFKDKVYQQNKINLDPLDPYIMMLDKITDNLHKEQSVRRLDLARQCLYLKVNESLTTLNSNPSHAWRKEIMQQLVQQWGWNEEKLILLDNRQQWKINEIINEHKNITDALMFSYKKLSDFFHYQNKDIRISQRDLHILGRKLYAAFEKKSGKVELIGHDHNIYLYEDHISLIPITNKVKHSAQQEQGWAMHIGHESKPDTFQSKAIKKSTHLLTLICWGFFNRVLSKQTHFILPQQDKKLLCEQEIKLIINGLDQLFPHAAIGAADINALIKPSQIKSSVLFLNIGVDTFLNKHKSGTQIATKQTNTLNYGSLHENLLLTIDQVTLTSWHELITYHFSREMGLLECLCLYLKWNIDTKESFSLNETILPSHVCCFSSVRGNAISRDIKYLFTHVIHAFHKQINTRYLFAIEDYFYLIWYEKNSAKFQKIPDYKELIRELSFPQSHFNSLILDEGLLGQDKLKLIFSHNRENCIQLFYQNYRKLADVYIIDERGTLYYQSTSIENNNTHINHYILFLDAIINRLNYSNSIFEEDATSDSNSSLIDPEKVTANISNDALAMKDLSLQIFEIAKYSNKKLHLIEQKNQLKNIPMNIFRIQVIVDLDLNRRRHYIIYANDKEFNSFEYGHDIYIKVAEEVINTRQKQQRYPIYITDIDLSEELKEQESQYGIQISQLLKFKQEIERRLNQAIKNL